MRKLVELSTNVAILLVCALLCWSYLMRGSVKFGASAAGEAHLKGVTLPTLPNYRWGNHTESLVLALRIGCHYCEASMPFYKRLDELAKSNKLSPHMLVVMPDNQELGTRLLQSNGLKVEAVFSQPLNSIDITGTPTLLLVDAKGRIEQAWIGQLPPKGEDEVIASTRQ